MFTRVSMQGPRSAWHRGRAGKAAWMWTKGAGRLIYLARLLGTSIGWMLPLLQRERRGAPAKGRKRCINDWLALRRAIERVPASSPHDSTRPRAGAVHAPSHTHTPHPAQNKPARSAARDGARVLLADVSLEWARWTRPISISHHQPQESRPRKFLRDDLL